MPAYYSLGAKGAPQQQQQQTAGGAQGVRAPHIDADDAIQWLKEQGFDTQGPPKFWPSVGEFHNTVRNAVRRSKILRTLGTGNYVLEWTIRGEVDPYTVPSPAWDTPLMRETLMRAFSIQFKQHFYLKLVRFSLITQL